VYSDRLELAIRKEIEPILTGMGFSIVELSLARLSGSTRVGVVLYRREGVGVDDCAEVSRLLFPRLENIEGLIDVSLEVSSPGIERKLKTDTEYGIFLGRGVKILADGDIEWIRGIIEGVDKGVLALRTEGRLREIPFASIRKARLDHTVEKSGGRGKAEGRPGGQEETSHAI
jgi:ribosome maturation factor RimP